MLSNAFLAHKSANKILEHLNAMKGRQSWWVIQTRFKLKPFMRMFSLSGIVRTRLSVAINRRYSLRVQRHRLPVFIPKSRSLMQLFLMQIKKPGQDFLPTQLSSSPSMAHQTPPQCRFTCSSPFLRRPPSSNPSATHLPSP
jgi:hypothetical protein